MPIAHITKKKIYARSWKDVPKPKEGFQIVKLENGVTLDGFPYQFVRQFAIENFTLGKKKKLKGNKARRKKVKGNGTGHHRSHTRGHE